MLDLIQDTIEKMLAFIKKTNKLYLGLGGLGFVIIVIVIVMMVGQTAQRQKAQRIQAEQEQQELAEQEEALKLSDEPLDADAIIEREKKLLGGEIPEELGVADSEPEEEPQEEKDGVMKASELRLIQDSALQEYLQKILPTGKVGPIVKTLKEMERRTMNPVSILRKHLIDAGDNIAMRKNAILGLYYIGNKDVIPLLKASARTDPDQGVRKLALFCVDFLAGGGEKEFFAEIARNDPSEEVKEKARGYFEVRNTDQ